MLAKTWSKWPSPSFDGETQNSLNHLEKCLAELLVHRGTWTYLTDMMLSNKLYKTAQTFIRNMQGNDDLYGEDYRLERGRKKPLIWGVVTLVKSHQVVHMLEISTLYDTPLIPQLGKKICLPNIHPNLGSYSSSGVLFRTSLAGLSLKASRTSWRRVISVFLRGLLLLTSK